MTQTAFNIPYRHPLVRDLAWVMASPGLLQATANESRLVSDDWCRSVYTNHVRQLQALDENPAPLEEHLAQCKSRRLGIYFESLLRFWLWELLGVEALQHNLPVFYRDARSGHQQTLGEFDFLFRLPGEQCVYHWEAAVKFYLAYEVAPGNWQWIGPGSRDRLDLKLKHMFTHQLMLAKHEAASVALAAYDQDEVQAQAFVKGYLFYPLQGASTPIAGDGVSGEHLRGWWLRHGEGLVRARSSRNRWQLLPRRQWLSPTYLQKDSEEFLGSDAVNDFCAQHFAGSNESLLLVELEEYEGMWKECARGFVVPPDWPQR